MNDVGERNIADNVKQNTWGILLKEMRVRESLQVWEFKQMLSKGKIGRNHSSSDSH